MRLILFLFGLACVLPAGAAPGAPQRPAPKPPGPADFAYGITLENAADRSMLELTLPDAVYAGVTRNDLGDLRVFNVAGAVVPHAFCREPRPIPARSKEQLLPLFPMHADMTPADALGARIRLTTASGTQLEVSEPAAQDAAPPVPQPVKTWIADARGLEAPIGTLRFEWSTAGASELALRIHGSRDLVNWRPITDIETLLRVNGAEQSLERATVAIPATSDDYLKIELLEAPDGAAINGVIAGITIREEPASESVWFEAIPGGKSTTEPNFFLYDSGRRAPADSAQIKLPETNMSLRVALYSRAHAKAQYQPRWSGEIYAVRDGERIIQSPAPRFTPTQDRDWAVEVLTRAETLNDRPLGLALAYTPAQLRFLAQGAAPYLLAYGSATVGGSAAGCGDLLSGMAIEFEPIAGSVEPASSRELTGAAALELPPPPPEPTPWRLITLWVVLGGGALLVVLMSLSLLHKLRRD